MFAFSSGAPKLYRSTSSVRISNPNSENLFQNQGQVQVDPKRQVETETHILQSNDLRKLVNERLGDRTREVERVVVTNEANTDLLDIAVTSTSPEIARDAGAFPNQVTHHFGSKEALFVEAACRETLYVAREAEIAYATLALVTDYDCWHEDHDAVSIDMVVEYLTKNVRNAQLVLKEAVRRVATKGTPNPFEGATRNAIFTAPEHWNPETAKKLEAIIGKYAKR